MTLEDIENLMEHMHQSGRFKALYSQLVRATFADEITTIEGVDGTPMFFSYLVRQDEEDDEPLIVLITRTDDEGTNRDYNERIVSTSADGIDIDNLADVAETVDLVESDEIDGLIELFDDLHGNKVDLQPMREKVQRFREQLG